MSQSMNRLAALLLVITAVNGAQQTGSGLALDLSTGVVDRFRSLPMARSAVLFGRSVSDVIYNGGILIGAVSGVIAGYLADVAQDRRRSSDVPT